MSLFNRLRKNPCAEYTDDDFVRMILQGGAASEQAFRCMTQLYLDMVRKTTGYKGLTREDVLTAYSEAFVQLRKNVIGDQFQGKGSLRAYFSQIFRNKCFDILRKRTTIGGKETLYETFPVQLPDDALNVEQQMVENEEELAEKQRQAQRKTCLHKAGSRLTQRENDFLNDFYVNKIKPKEMAQRYALKDERSASTTAVTYRKKLKEAILDICQTDPACRVLCSK